MVKYLLTCGSISALASWNAMNALLFKDPNKISAYRDRRFPGIQEEFDEALLSSITVYVGNMSFYTNEEQVYELFSRAGEIKKIFMGLDKNSKTPCGFCFVLYYSREDAEGSVKCISGIILDDRPIRVDFDWGFQEGRQWGRGKSGGQVRDEYRTDYDPGRGGYGIGPKGVGSTEASSRLWCRILRLIPSNLTTKLLPSKETQRR